MKKKLWVIIVSVSILAICATLYLYYNPPFPKVGVFDLKYYEAEIKEYPSNKVLGYIPDAKAAIKEAEKVWIEIYGERVKSEKPYHIYWDEVNQTWLITGHLEFYWAAGGVANAIIRKSDGKVLAVWHDK